MVFVEIEKYIFKKFFFKCSNNFNDINNFLLVERVREKNTIAHCRFLFPYLFQSNERIFIPVRRKLKMECWNNFILYIQSYFEFLKNSPFFFSLSLWSSNIMGWVRTLKARFQKMFEAVTITYTLVLRVKSFPISCWKINNLYFYLNGSLDSNHTQEVKAEWLRKGLI